MKQLLSILIITCWCWGAVAQTGNSDLLQTIYTKANNAYADKQFEQAAEWYEEVASTGHISFELYYNLGCTYFKLNEIGKSALNFERAKKLNPGHENLRFNLEVVNRKLADQFDPIPEASLRRWWNKLIMFFSLDTLAWLAIVFAIVGLVCFIRYRTGSTSQQKRLAFGILMLSMIVSISFVALGHLQSSHIDGHQSAIIQSPSVTVKSEPNNTSTDLFVIHEGLKVDLIQQHDNWAEVRLPDGNKGWIEAHVFEEI